MNADDHGRRGRPRQPEVDQRIAAATLDLIREDGPSAVNVTTVAARSGVAKTTIYRRFRNREELLRASLDSVTDQEAPPDDLSVPDKVRWVLARVGAVLSRGVGLGGVAAVLNDNDPEFTRALRRALNDSLGRIEDQVTADVAAGRLAPGLDPDIVVNLIVGAYLAEVLRHGRERPEWLERTADLLLVALTPR